MDRSQFNIQLNNDQKLVNNPVISELTKEELQVVEELCEISDVCSAFNSTDAEQSAVTNIECVVSNSSADDFSTELDSNNGNNSNETGDNETVGVYATNEQNLTDVTPNKWYNENEPLPDNQMRTNVTDWEDDTRNQRVQDIMNNLLECEMSENEKKSQEMLLQLNLVKNPPVIPNSHQSTGIRQVELDRNTYQYTECNMDNPKGNENRVIEPINAQTGENASSNEINLARQDDTSEMIDYVIELEGTHMIDQSDNTKVDARDNNAYRIHSIEVESTDSARQEMKEATNANQVADIQGVITPQKKRRGRPRSGNHDKQGSRFETPTACAEIPEELTSGVHSTSTAERSKESMKDDSNTCRSSTRKRRICSTIGSREEMIKTRYPNINELHTQALTNNPDTKEPFWQNLRAFICARSMFWKKEKRGIICPFSYIEEKHEALGYKKSSKHVLIKCHKNPQMPVCTICHESRYHVQEASKCEYCVKAYFELMMESEQGDVKEISDKWY
ncbi:hypothetical protein QAD02_001776 [Eretmocerus hayati]|uniref:Uncharacterized protein n=1 Tax=Eretmocerus hayati TaxID=131215 RepID=A0ACC2NHD3_9HYME|nr:hypothetical protein QAD02_001776 [Eretmocerus hayati]